MTTQRTLSLLLFFLANITNGIHGGDFQFVPGAGDFDYVPPMHNALEVNQASRWRRPLKIATAGILAAAALAIGSAHVLDLSRPPQGSASREVLQRIEPAERVDCFPAFVAGRIEEQHWPCVLKAVDDSGLASECPPLSREQWWEAIRDHNVPKLCELADACPSLVPTRFMTCNGPGRSSLHTAVAHGNLPAAAMLIRRGADVNDGALLHPAIGQNREDMVRLLLCAGADTEAIGGVNETALHFAVGYKRPEIAAELLRYGVSVDVKDGRGDTPLVRAIRDAGIYVVRVLLAGGADVDLPNDHGQTPLHTAARLSLHSTLRLGAVETMRALLAYGASVDKTDDSGAAPLHVTAKLGSYELAVLLLDAGASVDVTDSSGMTPLHLAAKLGKTDVARLLLEYGAPVNARALGQVTPLHLAVGEGHADVVRLLVGHGANTTIANGEGRTPSQLVRDPKTRRILECAERKVGGIAGMLWRLLGKC